MYHQRYEFGETDRRGLSGAVRCIAQAVPASATDTPDGVGSALTMCIIATDFYQRVSGNKCYEGSLLHNPPKLVILSR